MIILETTPTGVMKKLDDRDGLMMSSPPDSSSIVFLALSSRLEYPMGNIPNRPKPAALAVVSGKVVYSYLLKSSGLIFVNCVGRDEQPNVMSKQPDTMMAMMERILVISCIGDEF